MSQLPHRYATALVELATESNQLTETRQSLTQLCHVCEEDPQILDILSDIVVPRAKRRNALQAILDRMQATDLVRRYLLYLLERERLSLLPAIIRAFEGLCDERSKILRAEVTTAVPLNPLLAQEIETVLTTKIGRTVLVSHKQDPTLIGGLRIQVGSQVYDGSVEGELHRLQENMLKEAMT